MSDMHAKNGGIEEASQVRFLGDVSKLSLSPGDVVVLTFSTPITLEKAKRLDEYWRKQMGDEVKLLVLEPGTKIGILSRLPITPAQGGKVSA